MRPKKIQEYQAPSTGKLLTDYFEKNRIRKSALARVLNLKLLSILGYQKNHTIQTSILWNLSMALSHNFFMDIAVQMPNEFTTETDLYAEKNEKIAELEQEIMILKVERDLLLKVTGAKSQ